MADRKKRKRIFHVNILKQWHTPASTSYFVGEGGEGDDGDVLVWNDDAGSEPGPVMGDRLSNGQKVELKGLLDEFSDVLRNDPDCTFLIEHCIETGDPVRQPPYQLPHAYKEEVRKELGKMQRNRIIEPCTSEWASPIVLVRKEDGSLRLCVDYR